MRNRIRNILVLMTACILGILTLQGYWLYQAYQIRLQEFQRDINDALRTAVFHKQFGDAGKVLGLSKFNLTFTSTMPDSVSPMGQVTRIVSDLDSAATASGAVVKNAYFFAGPARRALPADEFGIPPEGENVELHMVRRDTQIRQLTDTLSRKISEVLVRRDFYRTSLTINQLDSLYRIELGNRGINTGFQLDTLALNHETLQSLPKSPFRTTIIPFNPINNIFVTAIFASPMPHILGRMTGSLAATAVLLLLTVGSFLYMLRTILRQKRLSEVRNDFINNMTHELKTPIATVSAAVEALERFNALADPQKTANYLRISRQELQRLGDLVEKVLHIAAEEKEDVMLQPEMVDLNDIIADIISNHRLKSGKKIDFSYTLLADPLVLADPTHLSHAINNLVDNAIKYSNDPAEISVHVARRPGWVRISVKDNGIGIPHGYHNSIFDKFFRVPSGNLHNVKGFGLGLSYVKKIAEKHGGSIKVKSEPDKGSEFQLEIPAA
ncbi:sensor histidine kinase [Chitinophaga sp. NPDC101104]|uniref:sensor histidine kinase n=1 Tax=Chitinophaga sp. NPDC101104 TaxID=3390561 RepID=UPI003D06B972